MRFTHQQTIYFGTISIHRIGLRSFLIFLIIVGCAHQANFSPSDFVGIWSFKGTMGEPQNKFYMSGIATYESSGKTLYETVYTWRAYRDEATCTMEGNGQWMIEGDKLIENFKELKLSKCDGDPLLISIIENHFFPYEENEEFRILEYTKSKFVKFNDQYDAPYKATFNRIR